MTPNPALPPITKHILKLAAQIDAAGLPDHVPVEPGGGCRPGACFENVIDIVKRQGGSVQYGWSIREQPRAFVEGEFYAVWRSPDGTLIDVTPRGDGQTQIVFLSDPNRVWDGEPIDSRRMMLHERLCYCGSGLPFTLCHGMADD
jgi:hypothetical protein